MVSGVAGELLQCIRPAVLIADHDGRIAYANPQAEHLLRCPAEQLLGKPIVAALTDADLGPATAVSQKCDADENDRFVVQLTGRRHGTPVVEIRISPLPEPIAGKGMELYEIYDLSDTLRHTRRLLHEATHDPLTGLANRRALTERLAECTRWEPEAGAETVLALLDLDGFKEINDNAGHLAGDEVLQDIARLLQAHIRKADMAVRLGGDEFVLLLIDCGVQEAINLLRTIKDRVDDYRYVADGAEFALTVSIGVACIRHIGTTGTELLERADKACYRAKHAGGNCITVDAGDTYFAARRGAQAHTAGRASAGD